MKLRRIGEKVDETRSMRSRSHHTKHSSTLVEKDISIVFSLGQRFDLHRERAQVRDHVVFVDPEAQPRLFELR